MKGIVFAVLAYAIWGCFPLFFYLVREIPPIQVLSFRIVFAFLFALMLLILTNHLSDFAALLRKREILLWSLLASILITINWFVFIWAVAEQRVMESSLGYFITPLVSLLLGRLWLKESVNRLQAIAGLVAAIAVLFELIALGGVPWVSLALAFSFGLYGLVRKLQPVESLVGLVLETLWTLPIALLLISSVSFPDLPEYGWESYSLLAFSGVVTAVPLLLFAVSVRKLNLVVAGFIMYLNPLMQFVTAVWILNEPVPDQRYVTFALVWLAMVFFIWGLIQKARSAKVSVQI